MTGRLVSMRCPEHPRRKFGEIDPVDGVVMENLIGFACRECRRERRDGALVVHRFDLSGAFVDTEVVSPVRRHTR